MLPSNLELADARPSSSARFLAWLDFVASQAAWWWCVLGARAGSRATLFCPCVYVAGHLILRRHARGLVAKLAAAGALVGLVGDFALIRAGLLVIPQVSPFMLGLWVMFAVSLTASAAFLLRVPPWLGATLGAGAGPLAYTAGERLGVLALSDGATFGIALEWMFAVPLLAHAARRWAHLAAARQREPPA